MLRRRGTRRGAWLACAVAAALVTGCGAKTGLRVPDVDGGPEPDDMRVPPDMAPIDAFVPPPPPDVCVELPPTEPPRFVDAQFLARIATADVLFLVDVTGSMMDEIEQIRVTLRDRIVPQIAETIPDVQLSVAEFADFPVSPYGDETRDVPFQIRQESTPDIDRVQTAVDRLMTRSGSDIPESHVEALYQSATGLGIGRFVPPRRCAAGTVGYPCFRNNGSRIILLFTDAAMHNGPGGSEPYDRPPISPSPATYEMALGSLRDIGAKVLGLYSGNDPRGDRAISDLNAIARDTGAVTEGGAPIVLDIGSRGENLDEGVVESIRQLVEEVPIDIDAFVEDFPGDAFDALEFVTSIETTGATPPGGATDLGDEYLDVRPGTRVGFRVFLANERIERGPEPQEYTLTVVLRGDGATRLTETVVLVVIPSLDGRGCEDEIILP